MEAKTSGLKTHVGAVLATFGLMWLWALVYIWFTRATGVFNDVSPAETLTPLSVGLYAVLNHTDPSSAMSALSWQAWIGACLFAPMIEEIPFRAVVCSRINRGENGRYHGKDIWVVLAVCGVFFGWAHGLFSQSAVFLQGVGGLLLAHLWFKARDAGGFPFVSVVAAHGLYNFSIYMAISVLSG